MEELMLSTLDNPYNPFTQFDEWNAYDKQKGYNTCAYLARVTTTSDDVSASQESLDIDRAMNEIIDLDLSGVYIKVSKDYVPFSVDMEG